MKNITQAVISSLAPSFINHKAIVKIKSLYHSNMIAKGKILLCIPAILNI